MVDSDGGSPTVTETDGVIMEQVLEALDKHGRDIEDLKKETVGITALLHEVIAMMKDHGTSLANLTERCGARLQRCSTVIQQLGNEIRGNGRDGT